MRWFTGKEEFKMATVLEKPHVFSKGDRCWVADDQECFVLCTVKEVKGGELFWLVGSAYLSQDLSFALTKTISSLKCRARTPFLSTRRTKTVCGTTRS